MRVGYACINTILSESGVQINRSMLRKTFVERGIDYASALALKNVADLETIVDWNISQGLLLYRMSSDMFPWMSEYELTDLPHFEQITTILMRIGKKVKAAGARLTYHPGPFNVLSTNNPAVLKKTVKELRQHGEVMDLIALPRSPFAKINIHIGGAYGDRESALKRFAENFLMLPSSVRERLTIENDDKPNMFSVGDLMTLHESIGVPIVFDYHHHSFRSGDITAGEAMNLASSTWPRTIRPVVHFSSSRKKHEDATATATAHADFIYERIDLFGLRADIMLEAKAKEKAALRFAAMLTVEEGQ